MKRRRRDGKNWWHGPENPAALEHVYECSHPQVKGGVAFVFTAIALEMPKASTRTKGMLLQPFKKWTKYSARQIRNLLKVLAEIREIAMHKVPGTKLVQYEMLKLAGPLFVAPTADQDGEIFSPSSRQNMGKSFPHPERADIALDLVRTRLSTTAPPENRAAAVLAIGEFADWWTKACPPNVGVPIDPGADGPVLLDLVTAYTLPQLQRMATLMWTLESDAAHPKSNRNWIATTDRSVRVLRRKSVWLAKESEQLEASPVPPNDAVWRTITELIPGQRRHVAEWVEPCRLTYDETTVTICAPAEIHLRMIAQWGLTEGVVDAIGQVLPGRDVTFKVGSETGAQAVG